MQKAQVWAVENKNLLISIAVIVVLVVFGIVFAKHTPKQNGAPVVTAEEDTTALSPEGRHFIRSDEETNNPTQTGTPEVPKLSYDEALLQYGSHRIQFGETCMATPAVSTYKVGTPIMIDNRASFFRTFTVGANQYPVSSFDYTVITPITSAASTTLYIDCGGQQNAATIIIQQ